MNLELNLNEQQQLALSRLARDAGVDVVTFLSRMVEDQITPLIDEAPLPDDEWQKRFDAAIARHKPTGYPLDDSRESIYPDRL